MISYYSWKDFDKNVEYIANQCRFLEFSGIYGIPRGGLCLAVALSHKLKIKLISEPIKNSLIVDDIYETGITLNPFKDIEGAMFFVLFSKIEPVWWNSVSLSQKREWIVFPWENTKDYKYERDEYIKKRGLN
jgi:hypoxanthine phosphoribosyltransferase